MLEWFISLNPIWVSMGSLLAILAAFYRFLTPHFRRMAHFYDDWFGSPARPGREEVMSFPDRMTQMEDWVRSVTESLAYENLLNEIQQVGKRMNRLGNRFEVLAHEVEELKADTQEFQRATLNRVEDIEEHIAEELAILDELTVLEENTQAEEGE